TLGAVIGHGLDTPRPLDDRAGKISALQHESSRSHLQHATAFRARTGTEKIQHPAVYPGNPGTDRIVHRQLPHAPDRNTRPRLVVVGRPDRAEPQGFVPRRAHASTIPHFHSQVKPASFPGRAPPIREPDLAAAGAVDFGKHPADFGMPARSSQRPIGIMVLLRAPHPVPAIPDIEEYGPWIPMRQAIRRIPKRSSTGPAISRPPLI